jgi:hypothetical protein
MDSLINNIANVVRDVLKIVILGENPDEDDQKGRQ